MLPISLYFDKVSQDGRHGQTSDGNKILYNLNLIDPVKSQEYTDMLFGDVMKATMFWHAGAFVIIVTASLEAKQQEMLAMDLGDNDSLATNMFSGDPNIKELLFNFQCTKKERPKKPEFMLVEGQIPAPQD